MHERICQEKVFYINNSFNYDNESNRDLQNSYSNNNISGYLTTNATNSMINESLEESAAILV